MGAASISLVFFFFFFFFLAFFGSVPRKRLKHDVWKAN